VAIAAGVFYSMALISDGSVISWGSTNLTSVPAAAQSDVIAIGAGAWHSVALVIPATPNISSQPESRTVSTGQSVAFSVAVQGIQPRYQWRKDGININGATASSLALGPARSSHAGSYTVVVSNFVGEVISAPAVLSVNPMQVGRVLA
jgi:hypothetical protein